MSEVLDHRFINLDRRGDRRAATEKNLESNGFAVETKRISAVDRPELPLLGCAMSHYLALAELQCTSTASHFLVLEDDWRFEFPKSFLLEVIEAVTESHPDWNVLQLSATDNIFSLIGKITIGQMEATTVRLHKATSAASYIVRRDFALTLNGYFADSISMHERNAGRLMKVNQNYYATGGNKNAEAVREKVGLFLVANDHTWGIGQLMHNFIGTSIRFGYCEPVDSDISPHTTDNHDRQLATVMSTQGLSWKGQ
jgi:GR25 family glycosyltransferase involved in LPS biosynthesis